MPNKVKRYLNEGKSFILNTKEWHIGIYVRLSKEDSNETINDSYSVINQENILIDYVSNLKSGYSSYEIYVDDGSTGTDSERKNFQRLLDDVNNGKINCVAVVDLSRLSRNYAEAGLYLEMDFVRKGIRFISINEHIDSFENPQSMDSIMIAITNVFNDNFCRVTSQKIRAVLEYKRKRGLFVGSHAPYGYKKDEKDKHQLIKDPEASEVIEKIYDLFVNKGMSKNGIAKELTIRGILNPTNYKKSKGINFSTPNSAVNSGRWSDKTISIILKNQMYIGDMVQGKTKLKSYKIHEQVYIPKSEWIIVEGTHEAIISLEMFDKAQNIQKRETRTAPKAAIHYLFSGFLYCSDCKRALRRKTSKNHVYYSCRTYTDHGATECSKRSIREDRLKAIVLNAINQQINLAVSFEKIINEINEAPFIEKKLASLEKRIIKYNRELDNMRSLKKESYVDWKNGDITKTDFIEFGKKFGAEIKRIDKIIERLASEIIKNKEDNSKENSFISAFKKHKNITEIDREILVALVDIIRVSKGGDIEIDFKFSNEYQRLLL